MARVTGIAIRTDAGGKIKQAGAAIERFGEGLRDFSAMWPDLARAFHDNERRLFETEGTYGGRKWDALAPRYAARKRAQVGSRPTLERTGKLSAAMQGSGPHARREETRTQLTLGTDGLDYPSYHQSGTRKMPARPPLDFGRDFRGDLVDILDRHVGSNARKHRLNYRSRRADIDVSDLDDAA